MEDAIAALVARADHAAPAVCLLPFMCICFGYAAWYAKKTANDVSEPSVRKGKVAEEAPPAEEPAAAA